ncbi:hypothetical protein Pa4123_15330 [Phytohabitans aurantiacus]|uniref:Uncharacterized protein n=1 Tax=Phytohabitans aurantiacus TaxID=3016789 RepID=A0ABQ5QPU7_9ACTN|nr:hypothetical protein Pa4123_15330 [Phytohabitans aurantiacus]
MTRWRVFSEMGWLEPVRTRDAVDTDTPASRLTSASELTATFPMGAENVCLTLAWPGRLRNATTRATL